MCKNIKVIIISALLTVDIVLVRS